MPNKLTQYLSANNPRGEKITNADVLNSIRVQCSESYRADIPELGRMQKINHASIPYANFEAHQNEFINVLINKIGTTLIKALMFENPLGVFRSETFEYGETLEEIYVGLADAEQYDAKSTDSPFKYADTDVKVFYHDINREEEYPRTLNKAWSSKAFYSDRSFDEFIDKMIMSLLSSDELDEYTKIKTVVTNSLTPVNVAPTGATPVYIQSPSMHIDTSLADWLVDFNKELIKRSNWFTVPSKTRFENAAKVPNSTPIEDQYLLCDAELAAELDSLLANAFNMDKASVLAHKIIIDEFPTYTGTGALNGVTPIAALVSKNSIILKDKLVQMTNIFNPRNLTYNYFLHHHEIISFSLLENSMIYYKK